MSSRRIEDLTPKMRELYAAFDAKMKQAKIPYMVTRVSCDILEQMCLYVQGRLPVDEVNQFRISVGLNCIMGKDNNVVTWTLASKHVTNMLDKELNNDFSRAFDIAILKNGQPVWDVKINVNQNEVPDYEEAGAIGESVGLRWGGRWQTPDRPHFEYPD